MVWGWTLNYTKNGGPFIVKRRKNWCVKMCQFGCVSLRIEKVSQISVSVVSSCGAASVNWGYSLLNPAALRSCKVFGSLYLYFWWIPSFASSCNEWKSACCIVSFCRLTICTMHVVIERSWKGVMKVEFFAFMFCMTHNASDVNSYADSVFGACALKIDS